MIDFSLPRLALFAEIVIKIVQVAMTMSKELTGYPKLKPAYILKIDVGIGNPVGDVLTGSKLIHWETPTGSITTAEGYEPKLEADVIFGADWLIFDPDNKHARPNVKALAKTKDGVVISFMYTGVAVVSQPTLDMFNGDPNAKTIAFGISTTAHTFEVGDPKYKFLENSTYVGNGRFIIENNPRKITVESRISQVIASNDYD